MDIHQLQVKINYTFKDLSLLKQALTHRSYGRYNYERLEFVGDGILDYVIALNLFNRYPDYSEGELSKMRAALVNQESLVEIAQLLDLGSYLFIGDGEEKSKGRSRHSILADCLEAIFAAISLDASFEVAKRVIEELYRVKLSNTDNLILKDSKSLLQEILQAKKVGVPDYRVIELTGPDHDTVFNVECVIHTLDIKVSAKGKTKKEASQLAAEKALQLVKVKSN